MSRADWQAECRSQQKSIVEQCLQQEGKIVDYCRWQGAFAHPVALASKAEARVLIRSEEEAEEVKKHIDSRLWSLNQDIASAQAFFQQANYSGHITALKRVNKQLLPYITQAAGLQNFYRLEEEDDLLEEQQQQVQSLLSSLAASYQTWLQEPKLSQGKTYKRALRYQGNLQEYLGRWGELRQRFSEAQRHYALAGDIAKQLQVLTVSNKGKQRFVSYYRNQAASRWARAADMAARAGSGLAASLADKANKLWLPGGDSGEAGNADAAIAQASGSSSAPQ